MHIWHYMEPQILKSKPHLRVSTLGQTNANVAATFAPLQPSGHYIYRQFNIQQFRVLSTQCIYMFSMDLRTNSDCCPVQH